MLLYRVPKNSGVTLTEMLVTIILLGMIAALAAPNVLGWLNRNRVNVGMGMVESALREAQKQAIRNGRRCRITINANGFSNPAGGGCLLSNRLFPDNLGTVVLNSNRIGNDITFSAKGNITIDAAAGNPRPVFVIYTPNFTNDSRCVVIENTLGSIRTGDYVDEPTATLVANSSDNCQ